MRNRKRDVEKSWKLRRVLSDYKALSYFIDQSSD